MSQAMSKKSALVMVTIGALVLVIVGGVVFADKPTSKNSYVYSAKCERRLVAPLRQYLKPITNASSYGAYRIATAMNAHAPGDFSACSMKDGIHFVQKEIEGAVLSHPKWYQLAFYDNPYAPSLYEMQMLHNDSPAKFVRDGAHLDGAFPFFFAGAGKIGQG